MTREEAIQILTEWKEQMENHGVPNWSAKLNALDMAIESLSESTKGYSTMSEEYDEAIEALSSDAVQGEWNTGKPTKGGKYIVTIIGIGDYRFVDIMHYGKPCMPNIEVSGACWYSDDDEWGDVVYDDKDIIAWIPLPTPYKGGDTE